MGSTVSDSQTKAIIFCADDFGMNRSINKGILKLGKQGRLSASSCLSKGAAFLNGAAPLAELAIQKGLHLNLTEAQNETKFCQALPTLIWNCYSRRIDVALVKTEIEEQCDKFEQAFRKPPDFVDGHQHVHQLPVVREALLHTLKRRYGPEQIWIRSTRMPAGITLLRDWIKSKAIEGLGALPLIQLAKECGFKTSHCLLGVYDFSGDEQHYLARLNAWLKLATQSDVIMCHPASGQNSADLIMRQREVEFAVLSNLVLLDLLAKQQAHIAGEDFSIS